MVNPVKYNWKMYRLWALMSLFLVAFTAWISNDVNPMGLWKGIAAIGLFFILLFLGFCLTIIGGTILNRKVDHPITEPEKMVVGQPCWLNGETHTIYDGQDSFTGKFKFIVWAVNDPEDLSDRTQLFRGEVCRYISENQEVLEESTSKEQS